MGSEMCIRDRYENKRTIVYHRHDEPRALIAFTNPTIQNIQDVTLSKESIVDSPFGEVGTGTVVVPKGVNVVQTVSHTFSKTQTLDEAVKAGVEVGVKAGVEAEYAGIKGSIEVSAKLYAEYSRQWGNSETHHDTVSRTLTFSEEGRYCYEASRSRQKVSRVLTGQIEFDYGIALIDERGSDPRAGGASPRHIHIDLGSFSHLLRLISGASPQHREIQHQDGSTRLIPVHLWGEFTDRPETPETVEAIKNIPAGTVSVEVMHDKVSNETIDVRRT